MSSGGPPEGQGPQGQVAPDGEGGPGRAAGGAPYRPSIQSLGETPDVLPDIPINAVFLFLFIIAAAMHMGLFKKNQKRGKKFVFNAMTFGFCMTRIIATSIRIAWAEYQRNISVGIAATIFVYAGIIILFMANLFFAQRIVRAQHPHFGWSKPISLILPILCGVIVAVIFCMIAAVIVQFFLLDGEDPALIIQKFGSTFYTVVAFLPIPIVVASSLARLHPHAKKTKTVDKFGEGSMKAKIAIVIVSAFFLTLGAAFRAATTLLQPIPLFGPGGPPNIAPQPAFLSKAAFYTFNFAIEICITFFWLAIRIDKRFHIPDGAHGPGSYAGGFIFAGEPGNAKSRSQAHLMSARSSMRSSRVNTDGTITPARASFSSGRTKSIEQRVSWGGVSRENISPMYGEDGFASVPYFGFEHDPEQGDVGVEGVDKEMGWDPKSGKWALRPLSRVYQKEGQENGEPAMMSPVGQ